jgi:hypothetical protein
MKKYSLPCDFGGQKVPFDIYVGEPSAKLHPLYFQALWLKQERGGQIPPEVMDSFQKLHEIALEHNTSFEELCVQAIGAEPEEGEKKAE